MKDKIKTTILLVSKYIGLFYLCKLVYRNRIRILCYHGFSIRNEEEFVPGLFIRPDIFSKRMQYLKDKNFNVISLDEAYEDVTNNNIKDNSVVITIDDGFYSTYSLALPILKKHNFPSTLYLTSYYFDKDCPIFSLAVKYMFWNSQVHEVDLSGLNIRELKSISLIKKGSAEWAKTVEIIIKIGQAYENDQKRVALLKKIGQILDQDFDDINRSRILNLINEQELNDCIQNGMDIELHTHRHKLPTDFELAKYEIEKNKNRINPLLKKPMSHFCYPSGEWEKEHWDILDAQNIKTSTTCENGLITSKTPLHAWSRFLDSKRISQIEFESELCGFTELLRAVRGK